MSLASPRRVVYTAVMGRYEQLNEQAVAAGSNIDFVCFTDDRELVSSTWTVRFIEPRFPLDSVRSARFLKVRGPSLLADYEESLWIDNAVQLRVPPEKILDAWLADTDLAMPKHSFRTSVLGEFDAVVTSGFDDPARVFEQLIHYSTLQAGVLSEVPYWTAILARRHVPAVDEAMQMWWEHLLRYSRRDQLSINFVIEALQVRATGVELDNHDSELHQWPVRVSRKWEVTEDRMANALRIPSVEIGRLENMLHTAFAQLELERAQVDRTNSALEMVKEELKDARDEADSYTRRLSWRLTSPFRTLHRLLRSQR